MATSNQFLVIAELSKDVKKYQLIRIEGHVKNH